MIQAQNVIMMKCLFLLLFLSVSVPVSALPCKRTFKHDNDEALYHPDRAKRDQMWKNYTRTAKRHFLKRKKRKKEQTKLQRKGNFNRKVQKMRDSIKDVLE